MYSSALGHSARKTQIAVVLSSILLTMSLSGCATQREYSDSEKLNLPREILDGTAALRQAREEEIARENLQILLTAAILVVVVIVALVFLLRTRTKQASCQNCGRNISGSKFCPNCGTGQLANSDSVKPEPRVIPDAPSVSNKKRTTSILLAIFFGFWTYLYSYKHDRAKFWISLPLALVTAALFVFRGEIHYEAYWRFNVDLFDFLFIWVWPLFLFTQFALWAVSVAVSAKKPRNF
jgi:hypothetical protein